MVRLVVAATMLGVVVGVEDSGRKSSGSNGGWSSGQDGDGCGLMTEMSFMPS